MRSPLRFPTLLTLSIVRHAHRSSTRLAELERGVVMSEGVGSRTRFAPSPTGSLHVGGARTALFTRRHVPS